MIIKYLMAATFIWMSINLLSNFFLYIKLRSQFKKNISTNAISIYVDLLRLNLETIKEKAPVFGFMFSLISIALSLKEQNEGFDLTIMFKGMSNCINTSIVGLTIFALALILQSLIEKEVTLYQNKQLQRECS